MTPRSRWIPLALLVCVSMTAGCATPPPPSAPSPRLILPEAAATPCRLDRLPEGATLADLEVSYVTRGAALVLCDAARDLAVDTLLAERALQDRPRPRRHAGGDGRYRPDDRRHKLPGSGGN
ncbi:MAG TPA: hypothetical protein VFF48_06700 [Brevundimonas sp.]|nr:hypothetical protein [Brevundimonas sp.]